MKKNLMSLCSMVFLVSCGQKAKVNGTTAESSQVTSGSDSGLAKAKTTEKTSGDSIGTLPETLKTKGSESASAILPTLDALPVTGAKSAISSCLSLWKTHPFGAEGTAAESAVKVNPEIKLESNSESSLFGVKVTYSKVTFLPSEDNYSFSNNCSGGLLGQAVTCTTKVTGGSSSAKPTLYLVNLDEKPLEQTDQQKPFGTEAAPRNEIYSDKEPWIFRDTNGWYCINAAKIPKTVKAYTYCNPKIARVGFTGSASEGIAVDSFVNVVQSDNTGNACPAKTL